MFFLFQRLILPLFQESERGSPDLKTTASGRQVIFRKKFQEGLNTKPQSSTFNHDLKV